MGSCRCPTKGDLCRGYGRRPVAGVQWAGIAVVLLSGSAWAVTPESPEVKRLIASGLEVLEEPIDPSRDPNAAKVGGKCVAGLAFVKADQPDHPRVKEAVDACRQAMSSQRPVDVYSNGLAIAFLCELSPQRYRREIRWYLDLLERRQKEHGGWGYDGANPERMKLATGDTSQTQYAALAYWEAYRNGFRIEAESLERLANWLLRTQAPDGCWGYQGRLPEGSKAISQSNTNCSMLAAGLGGTLICADLLNAVPENQLPFEEPAEEELPPALQAAGDQEEGPLPPPPQINSTKIDTIDLMEAIDQARGWMDENYEINIGRYTFYYLYSTERYQSFYELFEGVTAGEPSWYTNGYEYLVAEQEDDQSWSGGCGRTVDTAFAVLFLLRSTQRSIQGTLGEGTLVGGRGIPANVAQATMQGNEIVVEQMQTKVDELLSLIDDADQSRLDQLARDPASLIVDEVDQQSARRLQQLVRGGEPEVRLLAVRALSRTGNLDHAPTLIYALTDPEPRIVIEARDGLRFLSRRFEGFGPPDEFTDRQRYEAVDGWKQWYKSLRPQAVLE